MDEALWYQGVFAERAASLLHHGWALPRNLRAALRKRPDLVRLAQCGPVGRAKWEVKP